MLVAKILLFNNQFGLKTRFQGSILEPNMETIISIIRAHKNEKIGIMHFHIVYLLLNFSFIIYLRIRIKKLSMFYWWSRFEKDRKPLV